MTLFGKLLKHTRVGRRASRRALQHRQLQLVEENLSQLEVRIDVELHPGYFVDLALDGLTLDLEARLERMKPLDVDRHAFPFHPCEHVHERHLDFAEELRETVGLELGCKVVP